MNLFQRVLEVTCRAVASIMPKQAQTRDLAFVSFCQPRLAYAAQSITSSNRSNQGRSETA